MGTFNTYGYKKKKYGGAYPVWLDVKQKERAGGTIKPLPPVGTIIPAGSLVRIEEAGGKVTFIETFYVTSHNVSNNQMMFRAYKNDWKPEAGMILMKPPATLLPTDGTPATVEYTKIKTVKLDSVSNQYLVTTEGGLTQMQEGDVLLRGKENGTGVEIIAVPTGLTENDVWIDNGDEYATVASVFHGEIMEDRIQPVPDCVKRVLPMIKFQKGV